MKKFQSNVNRELRRAYPDRRRLETQCLSLVAFVKSENDILDCPIWVLIVNVVAMDMLKSKLPPGKNSTKFNNNNNKTQLFALLQQIDLLNKQLLICLEAHAYQIIFIFCVTKFSLFTMYNNNNVMDSFVFRILKM